MWTWFNQKLDILLFLHQMLIWQSLPVSTFQLGPRAHFELCGYVIQNNSKMMFYWWQIKFEFRNIFYWLILNHQKYLRMGNTNKNIEEQKFETSHPNFKDAKIITDKLNKDNRYIQGVFKVQNAEYEDWKKSTGTNRPSNNFLLLPDKSEFKNDTGLCGNTGSAINQYPYYPYLLSELITQRQSEHQLFKESELWYVLYSLAAAKQDIKSQSNKVGDIKPSNVFVNDDGKIKIANVLSWPRELPSFAKVVDQGGLNYDGYLAPEDFPLLQNNTLDNDANEQSEMYAIGATILSAGILDNLSNAYDYKNKTYEFAILTNKRRIWGDSDKYSDIFKSIILNLTSNNPAERLTINQLWSFIVPFQTSILEKKQFMIPSAPPKIEQSYAALKAKQY